MTEKRKRRKRWREEGQITSRQRKTEGGKLLSLTPDCTGVRFSAICDVILLTLAESRTTTAARSLQRRTRSDTPAGSPAARNRRKEQVLV